MIAPSANRPTPLRNARWLQNRRASKGHFMARRWILGVGTGHCGLELLPEILGQQPATRFTFMEPPRLRWDRLPGGPGLLARFARWRESTIEPVVGDAAPFYLPYVEEALRNESALRVIYLERPVDE